jgi:hypothetical protein
MSAYNPPSINSAIFDSLDFKVQDIELTQGDADKRYVRYPNAQGQETFTSGIITNLVDTNLGTTNNELFTSTTTGGLVLLNNAAHSGQVDISNTGSGALNIRGDGSGTVNIAVGSTSTSQVNIGRTDGVNAVRVGKFTFSGNNITLPSAFTAPTLGQLGYSFSTTSSSPVTLTTGVFATLVTVSVPIGTWIATAYTSITKTGSGTTTQLLETITAISSVTTGANGAAFERNSYGTSNTVGFTFASGAGVTEQSLTTQRLLAFGTTTPIYVVFRGSFVLAAGDTMTAVATIDFTRIA